MSDPGTGPMTDAPDAPENWEDSLSVAIVGMSCRFPHAPDVHQFWRNLVAGHCSVTRFDVDELRNRGVKAALLDHPNFVPAGYLLEDYDCFDAEFFGYSPREAELMDPQHRVLLECAWNALESAGHDPDRYDGLTGVWAGASNNTYLMFNIAGHSDLIRAVGNNQVMLGNSPDFLATRLSYKLALGGPSMTVQTACSTSLVAVTLACQALLAYQCDTALAGGVTADPLKHDGYLYEPDGLFSPDGLCRTFDADGRGTAAGNGVGMVVLKRLGDAIADADHIHAVIRGSALNNDGSRRAGFTAPSAESQAAAIRSALGSGEVEAGSIGYVEAHGTATILGDPIEFSGLRTVFGASGTGPIALGSVKTNVGHLDAAAGVAGLIKATLAVEHGQVPPSLHFSAPNSRVDLEHTPFFVNTDLIDWPRSAGPRRAGVSSFGLGGTNAHVVLEQAPEQPRPQNAPGSPGSGLMVLSARTPDALEMLTERLTDYLRHHPDVSARDIAASLALGRRPLRHRRIVLCADTAGALDALDSPEAGDVLTDEAPPALSRPIAFMFTGFGDQYPGMASRLHQTEKVFADALDRCAALLAEHLGRDIRPMLFQRAAAPQAGSSASGSSGGVDLLRMVRGGRRPQSELDRPLYGHAAVFAVEYALAQLWQYYGVRPSAMIGHSLGEYVAACVAGVFSLEDGLRLIVERARLIEAQDKGSMLAVALPEDRLRTRFRSGIALAAVNGPRSCVVAGTSADCEAFAAELEADGIASRNLAGTAPLHSSLMEAVVEPYRRLLATIPLHRPSIRFISNVSGTWITPEQATSSDYWAEHVRETVRFADGIQALWEVPEVILVELGPGQTLCSAALQKAPVGDRAGQVVVQSLPDAFGTHDDRLVLGRSLGRLWLAGVQINWSAFFPAGTWRRTVLPIYPFERRRLWIEPAASRGSEPAAESMRSRQPSDWFYSASWERLDPADAILSAPADWLIFGDDGLGASLAAELKSAGGDVILVRPGPVWDGKADDIRLDPEDDEHYARLAKVLAERGGGARRMVHLWSATMGDDLFQTGRLGLASLVRWARASEAELVGADARWDIFTAGAYDVLGDEPARPAQATVRGFCQVAPQEYPRLSVHHVDLDPGVPVGQGTVVHRLIAEMATKERGFVALRGSHRWGVRYRPMPVPAPDATMRLREEGVYLITGGLGKVGLELGAAMAASHRARVVLVSRTQLPDRTLWDDPSLASRDRQRIDGIRRIEAAGGTVLVYAVDVADRAGLQAVVRSAKEAFGRINGVLHAAGVTGDQAHRVIADLDSELIATHLHAKAVGTQVLDDVLADEDLDFALLFSSLSPLLGGLGFTAYAAANAYLDAFAQRSRTRWTSVNWEGWRFSAADEAGIPSPGAALQTFSITPAEGIAAFEELLRRPRTKQTVISTSELSRRAELWQRTAAAPVAAGQRHARPNLRNPYVPPETETEHAVAHVWQDLLGLDEVGMQDNFFELGGTSLLGVQVVHRLRETLGHSIPLTLIYEGPTVRTLAQLVEASDGEPS